MLTYKKSWYWKKSAKWNYTYQILYPRWFFFFFYIIGDTIPCKSMLLLTWCREKHDQTEGERLARGGLQSAMQTQKGSLQASRDLTSSLPPASPAQTLVIPQREFLSPCKRVSFNLATVLCKYAVWVHYIEISPSSLAAKWQCQKPGSRGSWCQLRRTPHPTPPPPRRRGGE